jgi:prolyl-tRNA editing enzyme YbaK/EbsC (Cys-tRNA(Pro) deacylase)
MIPAAAARVETALLEAGVPTSVIVLPTSTRTAAEAAAACGVAVGQIVKSLVFVAGEEPILVLTSGANQVDERRLGALTGRPVRRADAQRVRTATGFAIGGVPPIGHARPLPVYIDRDLLAYDRLVAAAGTPTTVFSLTPAELCRITGGRVADVRREARDGTTRTGGSPSCA